MKNVQISMDLFMKICRYFNFEDFPDYKTPDEIAATPGCMDDMLYWEGEREDLNVEIKDALKLKLDALARHSLYSMYKDKSLSNEERQAARRAYLDSVGMRDGYRWKSLEPPV